LFVTSAQKTYLRHVQQPSDPLWRPIYLRQGKEWVSDARVHHNEPRSVFNSCQKLYLLRSFLPFGQSDDTHE
jgi:hypothetical protein